MPTHQQLRAAVGADPGRFALTEQRMTRQIYSFVFRQRARLPQVIACHCHFAEIMRQRRNAERKAITRTEVESPRYLIGNYRDARRVRIKVAFDFVSLKGQTAN